MYIYKLIFLFPVTTNYEWLNLFYTDLSLPFFNYFYFFITDTNGSGSKYW